MKQMIILKITIKWQNTRKPVKKRNADPDVRVFLGQFVHSFEKTGENYLHCVNEL